MDWTFFFLMVVLKLPVLALLGIVWWAVHATPEPEAGSDDGGSARPNDPRPNRPGRGPRPRGPHGEPSPPSPPRTRPVPARSPASRPARP
ncbi:hypothetical protein LRS13_07310 [Svornostia abyssi]|uniref:Uncharacterized protein n=1 Tax=Svornostia abyssi TaxID=2898438 RepID=A0ABY5PL18_9ACTN|nr:hypothetical protein LRS13_07310 [Parviterribacteraceae bacterium J379]